MVVLNARDAADRGADIMPRTKVTSARRDNGFWQIETLDTVTGKSARHQARITDPRTDRGAGHGAGPHSR